MNTPCRLLAVLLLGACALVDMRYARAVTSCSATMTNLAFNVVDPTGAAVDVNATLTYSCTFTATAAGDYITMCFNIGAGTGGGDVTTRTLRDATDDTMNFQMYTDASRSQIWGTNLVPGTSVPQAKLHFRASTGSSMSGTLTLYGRVPAGQTSLNVGNYTSTFAGSNAQMKYAYNEALFDAGTYPATCTTGAAYGGGTGTSTFPFTASASVAPRCQLGIASDMDFGAPASDFSGNIDQTSSITMTCASGVAWQIGLDNGQNTLATTRRMLDAGNYVQYELYRDAGRSLRWGNTLNADTLVGSGSGSAQTLSIYGRVAPQQALPSGNYSDKITVTVTY